MSIEQVWVGLDLGLRQTRVCVLDERGAMLHEQDCETSLVAIKNALSAFSIDRIELIGTEAGTDIHIVRKLRAAGFPVGIFEARKASKFLEVRRNKTDAGDARGLADLARLGKNTVSQVHLKSPQSQQLRRLLVMRKRLVMMRVAAEGVLRSQLALHGRPLRATYGEGCLRREVQTQLAQLNVDEATALRSDLAPLVDLCESLRAYVNKVTGDLEARAKANPVCRRLMEVPGVGPICALSFYSAVEDPSRFRRAGDVAAYLGLVPRRYQSGSTSRTFGITKTGSKLTRTHLVTAATSFGNTGPDCALKRWFLSLRERAGSRRARVALARKLAVILLSMWKNDTAFVAEAPEPVADDLPPSELTFGQQI